LFVSACSNDDGEDSVDKESEEVVEAEEVEEEPEEEPEEVDSGASDFDDIIKEMEERTEGETEVIYENDETHEHDLDGVNVSLDGYTMVELNDFHTDYAIPFDDSTDGGVLIAHYTVENNFDKDVYYQPRFDISYSGATKVFSNNNTLIEDDLQITNKLGPSNDYELDEGEKVEGYAAYSFSPETLDEVLDAETADIEVKPAAEEYDPDTYDYKPLIGEEDIFRISLNQEGEAKNEASGDFYEDRATREDMGTKEMLKSKEDINETVDIGDSKVILKGYQFTEFTPSEAEAPRFESFDEGIVLLTAKTEIENNQDDKIGLSSLSATLNVNNGKQRLLQEGMLTLYNNDDVIEPGELGEWLTVFIMNQEEYEKIWKDKEFVLNVGPLRDEEAKDISKGKEAEIVLPD